MKTININSLEATGPIDAVDVYGQDTVSIPKTQEDRFEFTGEFRVPNFGEYYLVDSKTGVDNFNNKYPRLICKLVKRKVFIFTETGEKRKANAGEYFACRYNNGDEQIIKAYYTTPNECSIYTLKTEEK